MAFHWADVSVTGPVDIGRNRLQTWAVTHFAVVVARLRPHAKMHPEGWGGQRVHGSFFPRGSFSTQRVLGYGPPPTPFGEKRVSRGRACAGCADGDLEHGGHAQ